MKQIKLITSLFVLLYLVPITLFAQKKEQIQWITFEQLDDSLKIKPKKVFIDFYAEWYSYCKKMDRVALTKPAIIKKLNKEYYSVKMNVETKDTILFDGVVFTNRNHLTSRNPVHEIPLLLASRNKKSFSLPAIVILDKKFRVSKRYFEYLSPERLSNALEL